MRVARLVTIIYILLLCLSVGVQTLYNLIKSITMLVLFYLINHNSTSEFKGVQNVFTVVVYLTLFLKVEHLYILSKCFMEIIGNVIFINRTY